MTSRMPERSEGVGYVMPERHRVGGGGLIPAGMGRVVDRVGALLGAGGGSAP